MLQKEEEVFMMGASGTYEPETVLSSMKQNQPDVLFLGVDRVKSESMSLFRKLRTSNPHLHIILLTPLNKEGANVAIQGLKEGAIDYVTKPEKSRGFI
ncbi:MAG: response regulator, partial [Balneolaceae bacterium]